VQTRSLRRRGEGASCCGVRVILALVPPAISVIISSHNTCGYLEQCLEAVGERHEVIVVDSASNDGSQSLVRERFPHANLVELDVNLGYGNSLNEGI